MAMLSLYHWLPVAAEDVSITLPPSQKVVAPPAVMVGLAGIGLTVTVVFADGGDEQPFVVTTTVKSPLVVALYAWLVAPLIATPFLYHLLPLSPDDVSTTLPPLQKVVVPPGVMVGVEGTGFTVTVFIDDGGDEQPFVFTPTV